MSKHDCPQCGQDMRLPANAYEQIHRLERQRDEWKGRWEAQNKRMDGHVLVPIGKAWAHIKAAQDVRPKDVKVTRK